MPTDTDTPDVTTLTAQAALYNPDVRRWAEAPLRPRYNPADQRTPAGLPQRQALMRLRLIEDKASAHLPPDLMQELTASIDGVVEIIRGRP